MKSLLFLTLLLSPFSFAFDPIQFEQEQCQQAIVPGSSPGYYSVRGPLIYREQATTTVLQKITFRDETFYLVKTGVRTYPLRSQLKTVRDFVMVGDNLWLIETDSLIEFDRNGREINRYRYAQRLSNSQRPRGLDLRDRTLYVAHGALGLISFDLDQRTFKFLSKVNTEQDNGQRSLATSVTWEGSRAYISLTGNTRDAFNGVVVFDLNTNQMINASGYRRHRFGVLDSYARIYFYDGSVFLNNGGWIHQLDPISLATNKFTKPRWLSVPYQHQNRNIYLRVRGDFVFENDEIFGCALVERTPTLAQRKL